MASLSFKLEGLDVIRNEFTQTSFNKKLIPAVALSGIKLHSALRFAVKQTYAVNRSLDSVLIGKTSSNVKFGKNLLNSDLSYRDVNLRLAEFPLRTFSGNINPASKPGMVTQVLIKRGKPKIVRGKKNFGGFLQKRGARVTINNVFERKQKKTWANGKRLPIRPLYTIGLAKMAARVYEYNPEVQKVKRQISIDLLKDL